jgi:hypothetical protein
MVLLGLFIAGFVTWGLVVLRGLALERRQAIRTGCLIFVDDLIAVGVGIWLARYGGPWEVIAAAAGGSCAGLLLVLWGRNK